MKTSKWISIISFVLILLTISFGALALFNAIKDMESSLPVGGANTNTDNNQDAGNTDNPGDNGNGSTDNSGNTGNNGSTDDPNDTVVTDLLELGYPSFRYGETETLEEEYGIRFETKISDYLKTTVIDAGLGEMKWFIAPVDLIEEAGLLNRTDVDWVEAMENAGKQFVIKENLKNAFSHKQDDGNWIAYGTLVQIKYTNINRSMFGIMYIEYQDGTREYATFPEGQSVTTLSSSLGYVAVQALNDEVIDKNAWSDKAVSCLTECVRLSAGQACGCENADAVPRDMMYWPRLYQNGSHQSNLSISMTLGGAPYQYDVKVGCTSNLGGNYKMPIVSYSTNTAVAVVENGVVKAAGSGTCKIWFYCGTGSCWIDVTVT